MIRVTFTEEDINVINYERYNHQHPRVRQKMEVLWLKSQGEKNKRIAKLAGVSINVVTDYIKQYRAGGIEKIKVINFYKPVSELTLHTEIIKDYFLKYPPASIKEATSKIEELTGLKRSEVQVAKFLKSIGLHRRKVGMVPGKADVEKQEDFKKNFKSLSGRSKARKKNSIFC